MFQILRLYTVSFFFSQVIEGTETLNKMEVQQTMNERPNTEIKVTDCGICTYEF